jgi:hypothetical protein
MRLPIEANLFPPTARRVATASGPLHRRPERPLTCCTFSGMSGQLRFVWSARDEGSEVHRCGRRGQATELRHQKVPYTRSAAQAQTLFSRKHLSRLTRANPRSGLPPHMNTRRANRPRQSARAPEQTCGQNGRPHCSETAKKGSKTGAIEFHLRRDLGKLCALCRISAFFPPGGAKWPMADGACL